MENCPSSIHWRMSQFDFSVYVYLRSRPFFYIKPSIRKNPSEQIRRFSLIYLKSLGFENIQELVKKFWSCNQLTLLNIFILHIPKLNVWGFWGLFFIILFRKIECFIHKKGFPSLMDLLKSIEQLLKCLSQNLSKFKVWFKSYKDQRLEPRNWEEERGIFSIHNFVLQRNFKLWFCRIRIDEKMSGNFSRLTRNRKLRTVVP